MRTLLLLLLLVVTAAPARAEDYLMIGVHVVPAAGKNWVCWDTAMDTFPLKSKADYSTESNNYYKSHKGESPFTKLLTPDTAVVVFKYKTFKYGYNCEHDVLSIQTAHDVEAAKEKMEKRRRENPKEFRSEPQAVLAWPGSEFKKVVQQSYDGVEITYTSHRNSAGKTVVTAKGRNTNKDKAASIIFSGPGVISSGPIVLQPGVSFSQTVGTVEEIDVEVGFGSTDKGKGLIDQAIDYGKEKIRDHLKTNGGGGIKSEPGVIGGRG